MRRRTRRPAPAAPAASRAAPLVLAGLALVVAAGLTGCDLMTATSSARPSRLVATPEPTVEPLPSENDEVPTLRPEPSGGGPDLAGAADALADLGSYRVSVVSRGLVPAATADGLVTMTSTLVQGDHPAAEFTMKGADGLEGGRLDAVVIGDEAWLRPGGGHWSKSPGGAADFDAAFTTLSPIDLVGGFEDLSAALRRVGSERRNGIPATHYRAVATDPVAGAAGLTQGALDVWLAAGGGHLVALAVDGTWDVDGTPTAVTLTIEVSHVGDRSNVIRAPA